MRDVNQRNFYGFERAIEIKIELSELADAQLAVDLHHGVNFLAAVAVGFEPYFGFEQLDLRRIRNFLRFLGLGDAFFR